MSKLTFAALSFNANHTPVSDQFDDIYFSTQDGLSESEYVFQQGNQLWEKWQHHPRAFFTIAETGFGTGLNFLAVCQLFHTFRAQYPNNPLQRLYFISFEKYPLKPEQFADIHRNYPQFSAFSSQLTAHWQPRQVGCQRYHFEQIYLDIWFGDLAENLPQLGDSYHSQIDCWFLDGFSPDKNPEMWNEALYREMFRLTRAGGSFATFTAASLVRKGLQQAGFQVYKRKGFGKKREMLWGEKPADSPIVPYNFPYYGQHRAENADDIAIVGGGVASLFLALSLLERGKKVTLYCRDSQLAQNASGNLQGAIYPQLSDDDERNVRFYVHSFDYALQRLVQLAANVDFEQGLTGVALYAYNQKTADKLQKIASQWDNDLFQLCTAAQFSEKLGVKMPNGGAFIPQGGWLSPQQLVQNGLAYLATKGLKIELNHTVSQIERKAGAWQWQHADSTFRHSVVVFANGHRLTEFAQTHGIPLYPVRGQVSQIPSNPALQQLKAVLCYDGYLTPRSARTDSHCIGASHLRDNAETGFSLAEHQQNLAKFVQNCPGCLLAEQLDGSQNRAKVGIRAALRDRIPIVGAVPDFHAQKQQYAKLYNQLRRKEAIENAAVAPDLYLIGALGSRGLTTAPLLGELLAAQICGEPLPLSQDIWHALSSNRSWIRKYLKGV